MKPIRALVSFAFMSFVLTVSAAGLPRPAWALASRGTSTVTATSSTSLGIHPPISAGADVMIAQIAYSCCSVSVTSPSGWTVITQDQNTSGIGHLLAYHVVVSNINEPTTYTWSFSSAVDAAGGIVDYIGVENDWPADDYSNNRGTGATITALSVTPTLGSDQVLGLFGGLGNTFWSGPPSGMSQLWALASGTASSSSNGWAADQAVSAAGPTGTRVATQSNSSSPWVASRTV